MASALRELQLVFALLAKLDMRKWRNDFFKPYGGCPGLPQKSVYNMPRPETHPGVRAGGWCVGLQSRGARVH